MRSKETDKSLTLYAVIHLRNPTEDHIMQVVAGLKHRGFDVLPERPRDGGFYVVGSAEDFEELIGEELTLTIRTMPKLFQANGEVCKVDTKIVTGVSPQTITEIRSPDHISQHIAEVYFEPRLDTAAA